MRKMYSIRKRGRYGRLRVIEKVDSVSAFPEYWRCRCDCGKIVKVRKDGLYSGGSQSCGCRNRDIISTYGGASNKGHIHYDTYTSWTCMRERVLSKGTNGFEQYKHLKICKRWNTFLNFLEDMGKRPSKNHSIDRIDNSKGYYKRNCKWSTKNEQAQNRGNTRWLKYNGEIKCSSEWERVLGLPTGIVCRRIKNGWSAADALRVPARFVQPKGMGRRNPRTRREREDTARKLKVYLKLEKKK